MTRNLIISLRLSGSTLNKLLRQRIILPSRYSGQEELQSVTEASSLAIVGSYVGRVCEIMTREIFCSRGFFLGNFSRTAERVRPRIDCVSAS